MFTFSDKARKHDNRSHQQINDWALARHDLIKRYCYVAAIPPLDTVPDVYNMRDLNEFLTRLTDYVAYAHFCIQDTIESKASSKEQRYHISPETMSEILSSTNFILDFVDKYADKTPDELSQVLYTEEFREEMSNIGVALENRYSLEDQLVRAMRNRISEKLKNKEAPALDDPDHLQMQAPRNRH